MTTDQQEQKRIQELEAYQLVGMAEREDFDFITSIAAEICNTKISLISLVTRENQWFLSHHGLPVRETSRDYSFCAHAINSSCDVFTVEDASRDVRFMNNPYTTGDPYVRFYAGVPLVTPGGHPLGTLCVIDDHPKSLTYEQIRQLKMLARQTITLFELRRGQLNLQEANYQLKKNNELLNSVQAANQIGSWELNIDSGQTAWSNMIYQIYEVPPTFDHNKETGIEFYHPDSRTVIKDCLEKCIADNIPFDVECKLITAKGNQKWVRATGRRMDHVILGSFQDITLLKNNALKFKGIFNSMFSFLGVLSVEGVVLDINETALNAAGVAASEVIGKLCWDCCLWSPSDDRLVQVRASFQKAVAGELVVYESTVRVAHGTNLPILLSLKPAVDEAGRVIYVIAQGIPIQEIVSSRKRLQSVIEGTNVGTWEWNVQTGATVFNDRWAEIVGYSLDELAPVSIDTWLSLAHPEDVKESERLLHECFERKRDFYEFEARMKHKDGYWVWVYDRGKVFEWLEDGKPLMMYGTHQDITERKRREEELIVSESNLRAVNHELEAFSYTVAHDLRSPLRSIHGYAEMLGEDYSSVIGDEGRRVVGNIKHNASKMARLIDDLLAFSRIERKAIRMGIVDMLSLTNDVLFQLNRSVEHHADIRINTLPQVMGDYSLLCIVMMNLLSNAVKYSFRKANPIIRVSFETIHEEFVFSIQDNGAGFDMAYGNKLFKVFQRLHLECEFEGSGVGLATVSRIIEKHGGRVWAEGEVDAGATFYFSLPKPKSDIDEKL